MINKKINKLVIAGLFILFGGASKAQNDGIDLGTPELDVDLGFNSSFNFSDFYLGTQLGVMDRRNRWSLVAFWKARPFSKKVLIKKRPEVFRQYFEWRAEVGFLLDKAFLFDGQNGLYLEGLAAYSYGDFKATERDPTPRWYLIPGVGYAFGGEKDNLFKLGFQWTKVPFRPDLPPIRAKIGVSISCGAHE
ncbi:MAG: hypothetical protein ABEH38_07060 [Flavobacteriales bacterium]